MQVSNPIVILYRDTLLPIINDRVESAARTSVFNPPALGRTDAWAAELGEHWARWLPFAALLFLAMGAAAPLADIDLPMHLAMGTWILEHHAVPFVEPFAWTRAGAPYYAYSWLPEVIYHQLYIYTGALGLRLLHGLWLVAGGASLCWLARVAGWRAWTAVQLCFLLLFTQALAFPYLRPQEMILPAALFAWGCGLRALESQRPAIWFAMLTVISALAASSHLLFPLTAIPIAIAITKRPLPRQRTALVAVAIVVGWVATPYGLDWGEIFRLYFGHNVLFDYPSPIGEFAPGFFSAVRWMPLTLVVVVLAIVPGIGLGHCRSVWERFVFSSLWLIGLFGFALVTRVLMIWWLASLPSLALALEKVRAPRPRVRAVLLVTMACFPVLLSIRSIELSRLLGAGIATPVRGSVEPLALWLDQHVRADRKSRMLTVFNYGSYLTWRLPAYSMSIDTRGIFPDSAASPDAYRLFADKRSATGPWRSADLAILPLPYPAATVLDTAAGWVRLDSVSSGRGVPYSTGLWARRSWLDSYARSTDVKDSH
jgi:hypothetical protein